MWSSVISAVWLCLATFRHVALIYTLGTCLFPTTGASSVAEALTTKTPMGVRNVRAGATVEVTGFDCLRECMSLKRKEDMYRGDIFAIFAEHIAFPINNALTF